MSRFVRLGAWAAGISGRFFSKDRRSGFANFWLFGLPIICLLIAPLYGDTTPADLFPNPKLSPQEVVEFQLSAMRANDVPSRDAGIERAFRFASPANKTVVGPLDHFTGMVHNAQYAPLLNAKEGAVTKVVVKGIKAQAVARVMTSTGLEIYYLFILSKQTEGDYVDCWMTDGVVRIERPEGEEPGTAI